jgi:hypothetical protein
VLIGRSCSASATRGIQQDAGGVKVLVSAKTVVDMFRNIKECDMRSMNDSAITSYVHGATLQSG